MESSDSGSDVRIEASKEQLETPRVQIAAGVFQGPDGDDGTQGGTGSALTDGVHSQIKSDNGVSEEDLERCISALLLDLCQGTVGRRSIGCRH